MKEKQYDPAGNNENAPQKGMAAVNTFNEGESDQINTTESENKSSESEVPKNLPTEDAK